MDDKFENDGLNEDIENLIDFGDEEVPADTQISDDLGETKVIGDLPIDTVIDITDDIKDIPEEITDDSDADYEVEDIDGIDTDYEVEDANDTPDIDDTDTPADIDDIDDIEEIEDLSELDGIDLSELDDVDLNELEETQKKPKSKVVKIIRRILVTVFVIVFAFKFITTDTGLIGTYKKNFAHNCELIAGMFHKTKTIISEENPEGEEVTYSLESENVPETDTSIEDHQKQVEASQKAQKKEERNISYNTDVKKSVIIPYAYANESVYARLDDGLVCAATNYLCYINSDGKKEWELTTSVIDPIISVADNYILIAQSGGRKLCLYDKDKLLYDTDCEENILGANVSARGDCVLVTAKDLYKGAIYAYNKSGQKIYGWSSGSDSVLSAAISSSSRDIAVTLLNTDNEIVSSVQVFDITKTTPKSTTKYADTVLFDVLYIDNTVCAFGDNSLVGVSQSGKTLYDLRFDQSPISHYAIDNGKNTLLTLDNDNVQMLGIFKGGKQKKMLAVSEMPNYIDISSNRILYNMGRDVILSKPNGRGASKYTAGMDVRNLILIDSKTFFITYSNSVELVKF